MFLSLIFASFLAAAQPTLPAPDCSRAAGSLPNPELAPGTANVANPVNHIVVIMQENHSFDNYFGRLSDPAFYGSAIDGLNPSMSNSDSKGRRVPVHPEKNLCVADPGHAWNDEHSNWNGGLMDGFVKINEQSPKSPGGDFVMGYYSSQDLPYYYALANTFAVADRYFCSVLSQTYPNRFYLLAGTSFGQVLNLIPHSKSQYAQRTIFDQLTQYGITWRYYSEGAGYVKLFQPMYLRNLTHIRSLSDYELDLAAGRLPQVVFLDALAEGEDEHPAANVQIGQQWVAARVDALLKSSSWKDAAIFITYDENGGFYDHVAPPAACAPDGIAPLLPNGWIKGDFANYGMRVPFVAISPYAKRHFVSHSVFDHTSILKFIENKFNLPALTARDANADGFSDIFDFQHPVFDVPILPAAKIDPARKCNEPTVFKVPTGPVEFQGTKNLLCLTANSSAPLTFALCDGSTSQKFRLVSDRFGTYQIHNEGHETCLSPNWAQSTVEQASCIEDEDQGFDLGRALKGSAFKFADWHGEGCFAVGPLGSPLRLVRDCADSFFLK